MLDGVAIVLDLLVCVLDLFMMVVDWLLFRKHEKITRRNKRSPSKKGDKT